MRASRNRRRPAFTLVELLAVIAIIAVLVGLLIVGVFKFTRKGPEVETRVELGQLEMAVESVKTQRSVKFLPSFIILREDCNYNLANPQEAASVMFLQQFFGKRIPINNTGSPWIDWNGNGIKETNPWTLSGDQCLVFWLGGIPAPPGGPTGCTGFSPDPTNPATGLGTRTPPNFEFKINRLIVGANGFLSYQDAYGTGAPYAYFSSTTINRAASTSPGTLLTYQADCPGIAGGPVNPYFVASSSPVQFLKPNGFQIISAGRDGKFGDVASQSPPGWNPSTGYATNYIGADDMANFSGSILGSGQD
jgi:prepilin-type N-terminal cleavage/methylation domain-containing protein